MTNELHEIKLRKFAEVQELCGPSPVLSTESTKAYKKMLFRFISSFMPRDFLELMLIKNLADCTWEILRYTRLKSSLMDHQFRPLLQHRPPPSSAIKECNQAQTNGLIEAKDNSQTLSLTPDRAQQATAGDVVSIEPRSDFVEFDALEYGIECTERIDKQLNAATARRDDVLAQLERYREGLGKSVREDAAAEYRRTHPVPVTSFEEAHPELFPPAGAQPTSPSPEVKQNEPPPDSSNGS